MARLLAYLFEVTERFGMETRTELILLQRTMVVVEGVARGLDPNLNIWQVAQPIVEQYVARNVGPRALLRDLVETARVLARFGPKLPLMVEKALIAQADRPKETPKRPKLARLWQAVVAVLLVGLGALLAEWF
jgi:ubiquinone biosynthesis protein